MIKTKKLTIPKTKIKKQKDSLELLRTTIIKGIQEKKGKEIVSLDLRKTGNSVADCFIVCHGDSKTQVEAIARSVEEFVYKHLNEDVLHKEGFQNLEWVLLDYFNIVVHIFEKECREFYGIERLWADAEIQSVANN
jgi:ribosome-associated protein